MFVETGPRELPIEDERKCILQKKPTAVRSVYWVLRATTDQSVSSMSLVSLDFLMFH